MFKELLTNFFMEFVEAFLPDVAAYLDPASFEFINNEVFTDVTAGEKHEVDVLVKARFRGQDTFFLIHVENQASAKPGFPKRMFVYFSRLLEKYDLPIYPVVIFSYDKPQRAEPTRFVVSFPGRNVLQFDYKVIQLNRIPWRQFLKRPNPVAAALMTKMKMSAADRPKARLECLRLLTTLKLDPAQSKLIGGFIDSYLKLTTAEMKKYEREFAALAPEEKEATMVMVTSWERNAKQELVSRQVRRRFGSVSSRTTERLDQLSAAQLDEFGEALFDFTSIADLEAWLVKAGSQ